MIRLFQNITHTYCGIRQFVFHMDFFNHGSVMDMWWEKMLSRNVEMLLSNIEYSNFDIVISGY